MLRNLRKGVGAFIFLCTVVGLATQVWALTPPERSPAVAGKSFRSPDLNILDSFQRPSELPAQAAERAAADLAVLGVSPDRAFLDPKSGRWGTLIMARPLIPGSGQGNALSWGDLGVAPPASPAAFEQTAWNAFAGYLGFHSSRLGIDPAELAGSPRVSVQQGGDLVQIFGSRTFQGIPVRDSSLTAVINHGNLVLLGTRRWGDIRVSTVPGISSDEALAAVHAHLGSESLGSTWDKTHLVLVPVDGGKSYRYRLAWVVRPEIAGDLGRWEGLVDAQTGALLAFEDTNHYATTRKVVGGVLPVTNDGIAPDGVEQPGWPMPFNNVIGGGQTDTGGNLPVCVDGTITSTLSGPFLIMNDNCGAISLSSTGDIDFGTSAGTDCVTPGFGGAGNTHASRTGFYELNKIKEQARGQLPNNGWLTQQLQANMNINSTCNAFWNGTVNFYRSGGGCSNTGEIAGVFDHEWGHGMDANDARPGISNPGEGIADVYMTLRLNTSCVGRNFRPGVLCGGYGDGCTECTGVRDIDWAKRQSGLPHDVKSPAPTGIDALCGAGSGTPCGGSTHCEGAVYAEAVYDLVHRDLPAAGADSNLALELGTRLTYLGAGNVGAWFQCVAPFGGCNADGGYLNYLAADDDDGNIANGTPHMQAIFDAFNRHGIACNSPAVTNSGCAGAPTAAPVVAAIARDRGVSLSWGAVAGATKYAVYRTEGVFACDFGKVKIGETSGTTFEDDGLLNGHDYFYTVIAVGGADTCMGPASACTAVTPVAGPNFSVDPSSASLAILTGDGDAFIDNCEVATMSFDVTNIGNGTANNLRIEAVRPVSHPTTSIDAINPVAPSTLAACGVGIASFDFTADGLAFGDTLVFEVDLTSDELFPLVKTTTLTIENAESDLQLLASKTWDFETSLEGWTLIQGTFNRTGAGGGANGSAFYVASSANLDNQCDQIRSPALRLTATSTLSVQTNLDIENFSQGSWWDRANLAIFEGGVRNAVSPDGGRLYNASGAGASCVTVNQSGWANAQTTWAPSSWSATALGSVARAGQSIQLDIAYGTDGAVVGQGFWFDQVTVTNAEVLVADGQSDLCVADVCGDGTCGPTEDSCSCAVDCGPPAANEVGLCTDGEDNDCDGFVDCADTDCAADFACTCGNGFCGDAGEDCNTCPADCPSFPVGGATCGNGLCEAGDGEDCVTCPADCNGVQGGRPSNRFCCGFGGSNPVGCGDSRCTTGGFSCTEVPVGPAGNTCCGDFICEVPEDGFNCEVDCGAPPVCGNNTTESGEACDGTDLGGLTCADFGCTGGALACLTDCSDFDVSGCTGCGPVCGNGVCDPGEDCTTCSDCAGQTGGRPANRFCCGNGVPEGPEGDGTICDGNF